MTRFKPSMKPISETNNVRLSSPLVASSNAGLNEKIGQLESNIKKEKDRRLDNILKGISPILLNPGDIHDEVTTDRVDTDFESSESFHNLSRDILERGQRQPIRVRAEIEDLDEEVVSFLIGEIYNIPTKIKFFMQSGRRRSAACLKYNKNVSCFVSTQTKMSARQDDLIERFKENTLREDLTGLERYLSIAEIRDEFDDLSQLKVANMLNTNRDQVSVASDVKLHLAEMQDYAIQNDLVLQEMSSRKIKKLVPFVKKWIEAEQPNLRTDDELVRKHNVKNKFKDSLPEPKEGWVTVDDLKYPDNKMTFAVGSSKFKIKTEFATKVKRFLSGLEKK